MPVSIPGSGSTQVILPANAPLIGSDGAGLPVAVTMDAVAAAVAAILAAPVLTQPTAARIYQRDTRTGGAFGKGAGVVGVTVALGAPVASLEYRLRDADAAGNPVRQDWTTLATAVPAGSSALTPSFPASQYRYLLDVRVGGGSPAGAPAVLGTQAFGVGEVVAAMGQSLAVDFFSTSYGGTATLASLGITPYPTSPVLATWSDNAGAISNAPPGWAAPADGGTYRSAFAAEFTRAMSSALGVPVALVGHARGGMAIAGLQAGTTDGMQLRSVLAASGGKFSTLLICQGHGDAQTNNSTAGYNGLGSTLSGSALASAYQGALATLVSGLAGASSIAFRTAIATVPANAAFAGMPGTNVAAIRAGAKAYVAANPGTAAYVDGLDASLLDALHPDQAGNVVLARHFARAALGLLGAGDGDAGPRITAASRGTVTGGDSGRIRLTISNPAAADYPTPGLAAAGTPASQFQVFDAGATNSAYTVSAVTIVSATQIDLTLAAPPGDAQALDVWVRYPPDASGAVAGSGVYDTNTADGIGTRGRQLAAPASAISVAAPVPAGGVPGYPTIASASRVAIFDANAGTATSGSTVTALADQSGNGNGLVAASGGPALVSNSQNGLPGLAFAGSQSMTAASGATWMSGLQGSVTGLIVFKGASWTNNGVLFHAGVAGSTGASSNNLFGLLSTFAGGHMSIGRTGSADHQNHQAAGGAGLYKVVWRYNAATGALDLWINGGAKQTITISGDGGIPGAAWGGFVMGKLIDGTLPATMTLHEVELFSGAASDADVATLQSYATGKWG